MMEQTSAAAHETDAERHRRTPEEIVRQSPGTYREGAGSGQVQQGESPAISAHTLSKRRQLAVERVTENDGKKTPGVDGET